MISLALVLVAVMSLVSSLRESPAFAADTPAAAAIVDGAVIPLDDVEKPLRGQIANLKEQIYQLQRQRLDGLISDRLVANEAARRNITAEELWEAEVGSKVPSVTDADVEAFLEANKSRLPTHEPDLRERIRAHLQNQKLSARREMFLAQLRAKARVQILLEAPPVYRAAFNLDGAPWKGAADAPVVIVKFEDFHCPFCKESQKTIEGLMARYQGRLKVVHMDFPIDQLHPGARNGHVAARCAQEQGKFWRYHDLLYANAPKTAPEDLQTYAAQTALDTAAFERCVNGGNAHAAIQHSIKEGSQAGVTGTPAFFVNGRSLPGAQPLERFVEVIEDELARRLR